MRANTMHRNRNHRPFRSALLLGLVALGAAARQPAEAQEILLKNGTVLTVTKGTFPRTDVLVRDGKIAAIGRGLKAGATTRVVDATGKYVLPGIIDAHSHMCIEGGVNEASEVVSAEVDIEDVINDKDPGIKWALAGGVTAINTMHGSANPIGGLVATLKMRWGKSAEEMKFAGARKHIKFALGENPKRVHADRGVVSRLGVAETLRQQFVAAREYQRDWDDYKRQKEAGLPAVPPHKDLKLESLAAVLRGDIWVQCHCYRADEIEMLLKLSDEFGFHIGALQHVLEGYKVAPEIAQRGIGASTFSDFWGYKVEAYDGITHNAAAMAQWGIRTSVNSDSGERIRRLNLDAAKSLRYGGLTDDQCLALVTINPAWQLGVDKQTGSLEVGKDADISLWDAHPLSVYSKCVMTLVDGQVYFERMTDGTAKFGLDTKKPDDKTAAAPAKTDVKLEAKIAPSAFYPLSVPTSAKPTAPATFALTDARIVPVSRPVIERGTILVENGRIKAVGANVEIPAGVRVISASGLSVYPGFINAATNLGLTEISSVGESEDLGERGTLKAHLRAADAFHVQSAWVGVTRCAGVTAALVSPRGAGWSGQSALMHTGGRTVEESTIAADIAQTLSLSARFGGGGFADGGLGGFGGQDAAPADSSDLKTQIQKALTDAKEYDARWNQYKRSADPAARPPRTDLTLSALAPVARRERSVLINANSADEIESAVKFGQENAVPVIVTGGSDADKSAAVLNRAGVPVIYTNLLGMSLTGSQYDRHYAMPKRLWEQGIKFCIANSDYPNVALLAGMAAAYGLPKEEALKAITLYPAQILGVERDLGSLEVGKIADLLLCDGDPLEFKTKIKKMYINGVDTPLISKHSELYDEYRKKK